MIEGGEKWVLGVDTSRKGIHLSLLEPKGQQEYFRQNPTARGEALSGEITALLEEHQVTLADIGSVIVALGPGSFTGLRTGIAYCQGLCATGDRKLYGISSLALFRNQRSSLASTVHLLFARPGFWYLENGKESFVSEKQVLAELHGVKSISSDSDRPVSFGEWDGEWIKLDTQWRFSVILPILGQFESSMSLQANYLQPSYAER